MISTIILICLAAGTVLLGRSGDMFPKLGEMVCTIEKGTVKIWEEHRGVQFLPRPAKSKKVMSNKLLKLIAMPLRPMAAGELGC